MVRFIVSVELFCITGLMVAGCGTPAQTQAQVVTQPAYVEPEPDPEWEAYKRAFLKNGGFCNRPYKTITVDGVTYYQTGKDQWERNPKPLPNELSYMEDMKERSPVNRYSLSDATLAPNAHNYSSETINQEVLVKRIEVVTLEVIERRQKMGEPLDFESVKQEVKRLLEAEGAL